MSTELELLEEALVCHIGFRLYCCLKLLFKGEGEKGRRIVR